MTHPVATLYHRLLDQYGPQGWWPLLAHRGTNPTKTGSHRGYHPGVYGLPDTPDGRFEVAVGAVLTQNTAWTNVEKALDALAALDALSPNAILDLDLADLRAAIRPAGYYNMKARKLRCLAEFMLEGETDSPARGGAADVQPVPLPGKPGAETLRPGGQSCGGALDDAVAAAAPTRNELLGVWGIGPETADSIRLYAYHCLEMVVDAYTRRILAAEGLCPPDIIYADLKRICEEGVPATVADYQEFHALMVEHGKRLSTRRAGRD